MLLLGGDLLFEDDSGLGFVEGQLMHLLLIDRRMSQRALPRLAIQGQMHLHLWVLAWSPQATGGFFTAFGRSYTGEQVVQDVGHLLGIHRP
jgi:hypothetical protein